MQNNNDLLVKENNQVVTEATIKRDLMNMTYKQATFYAGSTIVPKEYQNNPSNCFIAVEMANRMGADPFQVMQSLNIIQGRPAWSSAFIIATINQSRRFKTQLNYKMTGSWKDKTLSCIAYATANDGTVCESIAVTYQMAEAEGWINKNGSKWKTMPELMIRYRAASFFGKQFCPDLLLGLMSTEEQRDIIDAGEVQEVYTDNLEEVKAAQNSQVESIKEESKEEPKATETPKQRKPNEPLSKEEKENLFANFGM